MISEKDKNKAQLKKHDIDSECLETCNYGLEYVAEEMLQENSKKAEKTSEIKKNRGTDWSGLSDLTIS